jgi:hypothetical protein
MRTGSEGQLLAVSSWPLAKSQKLKAKSWSGNLFPAIVVSSAREANHVLQRLR